MNNNIYQNNIKVQLICLCIDMDLIFEIFPNGRVLSDKQVVHKLYYGEVIQRSISELKGAWSKRNKCCVIFQKSIIAQTVFRPRQHMTEYMAGDASADPT